MVLFALAVNKVLCTTFRTVLIILALIHKQPVYAQLFKRNHIIFTVCALQLFQFLFQRLAQLFQLLYREMLANLRFRFFDGLLDFIHLFLNQTLLSFCGQGYLFKLAVSVSYTHLETKAAESAKKAEAEDVLKKLLASGVSADDILAKLK